MFTGSRNVFLAKKPSDSRLSFDVRLSQFQGHGRMNPREFKRFLLIARGSICELQTQLELSGALEFADPQLLNTAHKLSHEVEKMLYALLANLKNNTG